MKDEPKFSVLVYNFNNYEVLHEIPEGCKNPDAEYIYVTDNPDLKSETWDIVVETGLTGGVFDKTFQVRYNLFKYCHSDICVRFDGSMQLKRDITPIVDYFMLNDCDICVSMHAWRNTILDEYIAWVQTRKFPSDEANKALQFMIDAGYNVQNHSGLYQLNFLIERNCKNVKFINDTVYNTVKYLGDENDVHRVDQTVYSYVLNTYSEAVKAKVMNLPAQLVCTEYFDVFMHGTDNKYSFNFTNSIEPYVINKKVQPWQIQHLQ